MTVTRDALLLYYRGALYDEAPPDLRTGLGSTAHLTTGGQIKHTRAKEIPLKSVAGGGTERLH